MNGRVDHAKQWACLMKSSSVNDNAVASDSELRTEKFELSPVENMTPYETDILFKSTDDVPNNLAWLYDISVSYSMQLYPNISATTLRQWGFGQCLPFSWTKLSGKHCRHPIAIMGVVDTFGL